MGNTVYINYYAEVINTLFQLTDLKLEKKIKNLGRSAINKKLIEKVDHEVKLPKIVLKFIDEKSYLDPFTFLMLISWLQDYSIFCSRKTKKKLHLLQRTDLSDEKLLKIMLAKSRNSVNIQYLVIFHNYVSPFTKVKIPRKTSYKYNFNHPVIENHCKYKVEKGTSELSVSNYRVQLKSFFSWCCNSLVEFEEYTIDTINIYNFSRSHIEEYKLFLQAEVRRNKRTANGAKQHFIYVKEFFSYIHLLGFMKDNITSDIPNLVASSYNYRDIPSNKQLQDFFDVVSIYSEEPMREKLAYSLMLFLGLRVNEVSKLKWCDINIGNSTVSLIGKNQQSDILPLPIKIVSILLKLKNKKKGFVFSNSPKQYQKKLYENFKVYKKISGLQTDGGVHLLRHIYITKLTQLCTPDILQVLARHKSSRSTASYVHHSDEELTEAVNTIFNRGDYDGNI